MKKSEALSYQEVFKVAYYHLGKKLTEREVKGIEKHLLTQEALTDAMLIATDKISDNPEEALKYFHGICWKKKKEQHQLTDLRKHCLEKRKILTKGGAYEEH